MTIRNYNAWIHAYHLLHDLDSSQPSALSTKARYRCSVATDMSQHWIYINSPGYRRFVAASKEKPWLLWGAGIALGGIGWVAASAISNITNRDYAEEGYKHKDDELAKLPMHSQLVARKNREQLKAMLLDIQAGKDQARYKDLLDGKIYNTPHGTSMPDSK